MMLRRIRTGRVLSLLSVIAVLASTACENSNPTDNGPSFTASVSPANPTTTLGTTTTYVMTLQSQDYAGPVTVNVSGHPAGWVVQATTPSTVTLTAGGTASVTVNVTVPSNGAAAPTGRTLTFRATGGNLSLSGTSKLTVLNEYVLAIPANTGAAGAHWTVASPLLLRTGTLLRIRNDDVTPHNVHTNGAIPGFPHQSASMAQGQSYTATVGVGSDVIYCHDHGTATGELTVTVQ